MITRTTCDFDFEASRNRCREYNGKLRTVEALTQPWFLPQPSLVTTVEKKIKDGEWPKKYFQTLLSVLKGNALVEPTAIGTRLLVEEDFEPYSRELRGLISKKLKERGSLASFQRAERLKRKKNI